MYWMYILCNKYVMCWFHVTGFVSEVLVFSVNKEPFCHVISLFNIRTGVHKIKMVSWKQLDREMNLYF